MARFEPTEDVSWKMNDPPAVSCANCVHFNWDKPGTCDAFPNGIPQAIAQGEIQHSQTYKGDHGIQFEHYTRKLEQQKRDFPHAMDLSEQ